MGNNKSLRNKFADFLWRENAWIQSLVWFGTIVIIISRIIDPLVPFFDLPRIDSSNAPIAIAAILVVYFYMVARFSVQRAKVAEKLKELSEEFWYDKSGTLFNGGEPNIAFRISTFKGIVDGISSHLGQKELENVLLEAGKTASQDFARNLPVIYDRDVRAKKRGSYWKDLNLSEQIEEWADYDSSTGWGLFSADPDNQKIQVKIRHRKRLMDGSSGLQFGYFLAGYCETVLTAIISEHDRGRYKEYSKASLTSVRSQGNDTVELDFEWV